MTSSSSMRPGVPTGWRHRTLQVRTRAYRGFSALPRFAQGFRYGQRLPPVAASPDPGARAANPLRTYFQSHQEGNGITKWSHYFDIYHRHFAKFVGRPVSIVEIGVFAGGSMEMWREYFGEQCTVYGVDIDPACREFERDGVRIFIGDQSDRAFWARFRAEVPAVDIVLDDGGHLAEQQIVTLEELLPHIRPGGVYLCEDVTGYGNPFHAYMAGLAENLHERTPVAPGVIRPGPLQARIDSIHTYPYVTVVELCEARRENLVSAQRGSEWRGAAAAANGVPVASR